MYVPLSASVRPVIVRVFVFAPLILPPLVKVLPECLQRKLIGESPLDVQLNVTAVPTAAT